MSTRDDIAAALDGLSVDLGPDRDPAVIDARTHVPDAYAAFTAWPVWAVTTWLTTCLRAESWNVLVTLPAGSPDVWAGDGEALLGPIRDALLKVGAVEQVEPVTLTIGDASQLVPAMRFAVATNVRT